MRLDRMATHLHHRGLDVVEHGGWLSRGASASFRPRGVLAHHTGPWSTVNGMVRLCITGRADLRGPLCHVVLAPDGCCHVIASGVAHHAGAGEWRGLTNGNAAFIGIEAIHDGNPNTPWPEKQIEAFVLCAAALAELVGAAPEWVIAHREWAPRRKIDPVGVDMKQFRSDVARQLVEWKTPPVPVSVEVKPRMNVQIPGTVVDVLKAPGGGVWMLTDIGAVYAWECEDKGAPNRHPDYWGDRRAARLEPLGDGFRVVATTGESYEYP